MDSEKTSGSRAPQRNVIFRAIEFAARAHAGQYRKGTRIPYVVHPLRVAELLIAHGCSEDVAVAGLLHDTVEDTTVTLRDIQETFGEHAANIVKGASEPDKSDTWEKRKRHTIQHLATAPEEVLLVVCADKLDNLRSISEERALQGEAVWSKFNRPKDKQRWYFEAIAEVLRQRLRDKPGASLLRLLETEIKHVFESENA